MAAAVGRMQLLRSPWLPVATKGLAGGSGSSLSASLGDNHNGSKRWSSKSARLAKVGLLL